MPFADGTITITTGAVGTTFTVSGLSFQPTWIKFFWSGRPAIGEAQEDHRFGEGIAVSTTSRRVYTSQSDDGPTTSACDRVWRNDSCVAVLSPAGASAGKADLDAILSDGFRLIVDEVFAIALVVGWVAGTGESEIVDIAEPGATGNQDIATSFALDTGLDDKAVIFLGTTPAAANTITVQSAWMSGFSAGNTIANAVCSGFAADAQGSAITWGYCRAQECIVATSSADAITSRASVTAWLSTGFRLNWAEVDAGAAHNFSALVIKGGRWEVGNALTRTDLLNGTEATTYEPDVLMVISRGRAENASDTTTDGDERSVGVATSATSRRCAAIHDVDTVANMVIGSSFEETEMYTNADAATPPAVEGRMDLVSFDATPGFTYVMDDADPAAAFFAYLAGSDVAAAAGQPTMRRLGGIPGMVPGRQAIGRSW